MNQSMNSQFAYSSVGGGDKSNSLKGTLVRLEVSNCFLMLFEFNSNSEARCPLIMKPLRRYFGETEVIV